MSLFFRRPHPPHPRHTNTHDHSHSQPHVNNGTSRRGAAAIPRYNPGVGGTHTMSLCHQLLLGGEIKVETGLEAVELELAGGEEAAGSGGGGHGVEELLLDLEAGLVTGQETGLLVGGVKRVDKGVDAGAVGAVG